MGRVSIECQFCANHVFHKTGRVEPVIPSTDTLPASQLFTVGGSGD
jgi:hypothetical protein